MKHQPNRQSDRSIARTAAIIIRVVAPALVLAGCATMPALEPPSVTVSNIRAVDVTLFETTLEVDLRVANPNPEALAVEGASFKLYLDGRKIGSGMTPEVVEVPRLESAVLHAKFHINNASALMRLREILERRDVDYEVRGRLFVTRSYGTKALKVHNFGHLDLEAPIGQSEPTVNGLPSPDDFEG